jgi:SAM-dependent methyltransferase
MDLHELPAHPFERHPWEIARARFFREMLVGKGILAGARRVLDVGAGDGYLARELLAALPAGGSVVCFDPHYRDDQLKGEGAVSFTRVRPPGPFDLVLLLDVIEHVADDGALLAEALASLTEGGRVLVSVPAWQSLYTKHDLFLGHHRRYRPAQLRAALGGAGLAIEKEGSLFHSLLLVRAAEKLAELGRGVRSRPVIERFGGGDEAGVGQWKGGRALTRVVRAALAFDNRLSLASAALRLPVPGLSSWALCKRA